MSDKQTKFLFVKPREPELVIRDPRTMAKLPPWGKRVPANSYWIRRLNCKDIVLTTQEDIDKGRAEAESELDVEAPKTTEKSSHSKRSGKGRG